MSGDSYNHRRVISNQETEYLDALVRGIYANRDLPKGYIFAQETFADDFMLAVPLRKGQLSTREVLNGLELTSDIKSGDPLTINQVNGPYNENENLRIQILNRGY
jgi:N-acetylneuraminate synthase